MDLNKELPKPIVENAVRKFLNDNKDQLFNYIMDEIGDFAIRVRENAYSQHYEVEVTRNEYLEAEIKKLNFQVAGKCPECGEVIRGWEMPVGFYAPEVIATLKERGIDPYSGHKLSCSNKDYKIS